CAGKRAGNFFPRKKFLSRNPHGYRRIRNGQGISRELAGNIFFGSIAGCGPQPLLLTKINLPYSRCYLAVPTDHRGIHSLLFAIVPRSTVSSVITAPRPKAMRWNSPQAHGALPPNWRQTLRLTDR